MTWRPMASGQTRALITCPWRWTCSASAPPARPSAAGSSRGFGRALEHDRPSLLFELAADRLRAGRMVRLEFTQLERLVASVRAEATGETYRRLEGLLDTRRRETLDGLLVDDPALHRSRLSWLRQPAVAITPRAILGELDKLAFLRGLGVEGWDVSALSPIGSSFSRSSRPRASVQALARISEERRYPILLCFGAQALVEITDELVDLFDRCLQTAYGRARRELDELRRSEARSTNEKVRLLVGTGGGPGRARANPA